MGVSGIPIAETGAEIYQEQALPGMSDGFAVEDIHCRQCRIMRRLREFFQTMEAEPGCSRMLFSKFDWHVVRTAVQLCRQQVTEGMRR